MLKVIRQCGWLSIWLAFSSADVLYIHPQPLFMVITVGKYISVSHGIVFKIYHRGQRCLSFYLGAGAYNVSLWYIVHTRNEVECQHKSGFFLVKCTKCLHDTYHVCVCKYIQ